MLLTQSCPAYQGLGSGWTGYGGVGDYRFSNGNTAEVIESAHRIRDHAYDQELSHVIDTNENYDVVVVGGGFAGLTALYEFQKCRPQGSALLIENHPIFGGFAKQNEFDVGGYRLAGPQASINFHLPGPGVVESEYWQELGLPQNFEFAQPEGADSAIVFSKATSAPLYFGEQCASVGYYFQNALTQDKGVWIKDIWNGDLERAPFPNPVKKGLLALRDIRLQQNNDTVEPKWLDGITFADWVTNVMHLSPDVLGYMTPVLGTIGLSPQVSAYAASFLPGVGRFSEENSLAELGAKWASFPGGNTTLLRHFVKAVFPDGIQGPRTFDSIANSPINLSALDRPRSRCRMRLSATAARVSQDGKDDRVSIVYEKNGKFYRVRAKGAVVAIGGWVAKHIVKDLPSEYQSAFDRMLYSPILIANVALTNWRFLDKLGFSTARWFDGFGFYCTIRQPMVIGKRPTPFHPDKPVVMTFYVPIQRTDLPLEAQGPAARAKLYGTTYLEYERQIVAQMERLFSPGGFNARRDIAGIVLNRWGHAFLAPPPGFYFGKDGLQSPLEILRKPFGRIAFGHSELGGGSWKSATVEGKRAITQVLSVL